MSLCGLHRLEFTTYVSRHPLCVTSQIDIHIIPNCSQQDATFLDLIIFTGAVHVSGGSSAHHQEHITVYTASGTDMYMSYGWGTH